MADAAEPNLAALSAAEPAQRLEAAATLEHWLKARGTEGRCDWEAVTVRILPGLIRCLGDPEKGVQVHAANCLEWLAQRSAAVMPALRQAMDGEDRRKAWGAALVAGRLGLWMPEMHRALREAMATRDRDLRWAAAHLAQQLGRTHREAVDMVVETLQTSPHPTARKMAAYCLGAMGQYAPVEAPLVGALADPHREVRRAVLLALYRVPDLSPETLRQIGALRFDPDPQVRRTAEVVLARRLSRC